MSFKKQFERDVLEGLSLPQKKLSSKYFYDETGDKIFQEIMHLKEYYLPDAELEILQTKTVEMMEGFPFQTFDVVELGAGDGSKTLHFLRHLVSAGKDVTYRPLDISADVLDTNMELIKAQIPMLKVEPLPGDYFQTLSQIPLGTPKIILFLGSNIGNYENRTAISFLEKVKQEMQEGDRLLVGIDLRKNPKTILDAYNDKSGVTKRFNLNLLKRINRELDADFDLTHFDHYATYNPLNGITYSFLVSLKAQNVRVGQHHISFTNGEVIHTEVSQKYNLAQIESLKTEAGFSNVHHFLDKKDYFSISVFQL